MNQRLTASTPLHDWHEAHGGKMVDFAGWQMPLQYGEGILREHLATRKYAGMFDVSHMGRFAVRGSGAVPFLQHCLSNDAAALQPGQAQYTLIPNPDGSVRDDAYLYCFADQDYGLVVNASNRDSDWHALASAACAFDDLTLEDLTASTAMIALQGPRSEEVLVAGVDEGDMPAPRRNRLSSVVLAQTPVRVSRTGYTGEPVAFELFMPAERTVEVWRRLYDVGQAHGLQAVGLGARDTLRLEAGLPLYGHEFGMDREGTPIPAYAVPLAAYAISFSEQRGSFVGAEALAAQCREVQKIKDGQGTDPAILPRRVKALALLDKGVARQGDAVWVDDRCIGSVTSGTTVPYWISAEDGASGLSDRSARRAIALAYLDASVAAGQSVAVQVRGRRLRGRIVPRHGRPEAGCFRAEPITDNGDNASR